MSAVHGCPIRHGDALGETAIDDRVRRIVSFFNTAYDIVDVGQIVSYCAVSVLSSHPTRDDMSA